jgi:diguanylate cyclase (GGDEF)-like protein/PAS domain S-box-containing protein
MLDEPQPLISHPGAEGLFDAAPEALLLVVGDHVVAANATALEIVGSDPIGAAVTDLLRGWTGIDSGSPVDAELVRGTQDALPVEVRTRANADGGLVVSLRDARELLAGREAMEQLFEAEARYRGIVEQIPAVVYEDAGDQTIYVSPQIERILGVTPQEYVADSGMWLRMVHKDDRETVRAQSEAFLSGEGGDLDDYRMVRPDGRVVWVRDRAFAFRDEAGRVILEQGILFDVTQLKDAEARIAHMAYHDGLTGLANRQLFEESLQLAMERARRDGSGVAVLFLDLDNFKSLNDTLGHHAGDRLLVGLAKRLDSVTRGSDLVARHGGDEFLVMLADLQPTDADETIRRVLRRLRQALSTPIELDGTRYVARASIGISRFPIDASDVESLLQTADVAMYAAKRTGPDSDCFFSDCA